MTTKNPVSMIDVARLAGVSTTTVSHVLNNTRFVSEETREKVNAAIRQLNYVPNASARTLKTGKTHKIQFIISDVDNSFFTSLIDTIENELAGKGYQLLLANTHENWERERKHLQSVSRSTVDGLILSTAQTDWKVLQKFLPSDIPIILIDRQPKDCSVDSVSISTYKAVYRAIIRLHQAGYTKIGLIGARENLSTSIERDEAYKDAVSDLHLEPYIAPSDSLRNSSPSRYQMLVQQGCTAILIANERMTEDIVHYQYKNPEELKKGISLVGFADSGEPYWLLERMIIQPTDEMGRYAAGRLLQMIADEDLPPIEKTLEAQYVEEK